MQGFAAEDHGVGFGTARADLQDVKSAEGESKSQEAAPALTEEREVPYDPEFPDDVYPTPEELATLEKHPDSLPVNAYLIGLVELCERLSYYGCSAVYTNFIQQPLPPRSTTGAIVAGSGYDQPGALGMGQRASTGLTTFNSFWNYVTPLFGGWIADTYLGRYKTILYGIACAIFGHLILVISALPPIIQNSDASVAVFAVGLVVVGLGTGAFKPNISPMIAEQYKRKHIVVRTTKRGKKYLIDPTLTHARIFMYFYGLINIGVIVGQVGMVYAERRVGFWLAYTIPTCIFTVSPTIMILARKRYSHTPPQGSVLGKSFRVVRMALKGTWSWNPRTLYRTWSSEEMWEKAKPSNMQTVPAKVTWDDNWVDQVRRGMSACVVFLPFPIYWIAYNQIFNNLLSQAATMTRHGVPNDLLQNLDPIAILIFIPLFDFVIYPFFRKVGIRHTPIRKMTWGFFAGALAMMSAAILQHYIYNTNPCGYYVATCSEPSSINVWAQIPEYALVGLSEVFASITGLEYAFTKAPVNMRSLVTAVWLFMTAIGNAITEGFVALSEDPLLVWNYGVVCVLATVVGTVFWLWFRGLDAQEEAFNAVTERAAISPRELATQSLAPAVERQSAAGGLPRSSGARGEEEKAVSSAA